jgi:exodeoxyribonuclease V alpha subunit
VRIFKTYGHDAIQVMTEDPYRLARDIRGIGFRTADAMAMKMGMTREAPQRLRAGVSFALQEATDDGHCGLPVDNLLTLAAKLLDVDKALVRAALDHELAGAEVVGDTIGGEACVFLRGLHIAERGVAERLRALVRGALPWPAIDVEKALPWVEKKTGMMLAASQRAAIEMALRSKAMVITGGPGVGKTTLLDAILRILAAKGTKILLAAPTGRAAKRMTEQTGIEAKTIHRLLEIDPKTGGFRRRRRQSSRLRSARDRRNQHGRYLADVFARQGGPCPSGAFAGRRRRSASLGRPGSGSRRHHQFRRDTGRAVDRGVSSGRRESDRRQRAPDQSR